MAKENAHGSRDALILEYQSYVQQIVGSLINKLNLPVVMFDEYTSAGYLGLVEAAERYDASHGTDFKYYAFLRIRGAVIDSIRRSSELRGRAYRYAKAARAAQDLREDCIQRHEQNADDKVNYSAAAELGRVLEFVAQGALAYRLSNDEAENEFCSAQDLHPNPETVLEKHQEKSALRKLVEKLPEKERKVVNDYYFYGKSFIQIAEESGMISKSWISRLHSRALKLLKDAYFEEFSD